MASRFTFTKGTPQYRNYRIGVWALIIAIFLLIGFAFVDVGSISIGANKYNLSLIRLNKAIAYGVAILGLQVVIGYTGQIALGPPRAGRLQGAARRRAAARAVEDAPA